MEADFVGRYRMVIIEANSGPDFPSYLAAVAVHPFDFATFTSFVTSMDSLSSTAFGSSGGFLSSVTFDSSINSVAFVDFIIIASSTITSFATTASSFITFISSFVLAATAFLFASSSFSAPGSRTPIQYSLLFKYR